MAWSKIGFWFCSFDIHNGVSFILFSLNADFEKDMENVKFCFAFPTELDMLGSFLIGTGGKMGGGGEFENRLCFDIQSVTYWIFWVSAKYRKIM